MRFARSFVILRARKELMEMLGLVGYLVPRAKKDLKDLKGRKEFPECRETQ